MTTQIDLIKKHGLQIRGHLGQHILIDSNIARKIVGLLDLKAGDVVLEIGPGLGALTWHLLEYPVHLTAVEKDEKILEILRLEVAQRKHPGGQKFAAQVSWVRQDFLDFDFRVHFKLPAKKKIKVISNLPYYITAPILLKLTAQCVSISRAVLMMQKEVAQRLFARCDTKDYGRLSIAVQYFSAVTHAFDVPPSCFTPRPKVDSSVVVLEFHGKRPLSLEREKQFFDLVKLAFSQRRKVFSGLLAHSQWVNSREKAVEVLSACGISPEARGENLSLKDFMLLTETLGKEFYSRRDRIH
jgi:16S rRNA (adenine1518-N6/adenine1519-N6)-dimethyltransferase